MSGQLAFRTVTEVTAAASSPGESVKNKNRIRTIRLCCQETTAFKGGERKNERKKKGGEEVGGKPQSLRSFKAN